MGCMKGVLPGGCCNRRRKGSIACVIDRSAIRWKGGVNHIASHPA